MRTALAFSFINKECSKT